MPMVLDNDTSQAVEKENKALGKIFAVYNPVAGSTNVEDVIRRFRQSLQDGGFEFKIHEWKENEDLDATIRDALQEGYQRVIAIGGDGTFSRVANSLVGSEIPVAFLPVGSTNVIARDLKIPLQVGRAIHLCLTGKHTRSIDVMKMGKAYYFMNVSIGLTAEAVQNTKRQEKRKMAWLAYILSGLTQLSGMNLKRFQITIDKRQLEARASEVNITNMGLIGFEPFRWDERVQPDDGYLDLHILRARTLLDYLQLGLNMILRRSSRTPSLRSFRAQERIVIQTEKPLTVQSDGELIGKTPIEVHIAAKAIKVIVPEKK